MLITHREFSGKTITTYGTVPVFNHGTHVAGLAAANDDGLGMMGVAPDANLHMTSFSPSGGGTVDFPNLVGGTNAAAALGAVAQNNSWGFNKDPQLLANYLASHPSASLAQGMQAQIGYSSSDLNNYLNALRNFENSGVVVYAVTNDDTFANGSMMASLPAFNSSLAKAWISVVNGYYETDANDNITTAVRISGQCGYAAPFCLAADGMTISSEAASNTDYDFGTGTSYVAPQVSGAVALIAQAFPNLTPEHWADRLLASANNSWFSAQGVSVDGSVDFGNGVTHAYSKEWGHGVLDIKAALSPIGSLSVLSGANVASSERVPLNAAALNTPATYGDGLKAALDGQNFVVFDALNGDFATNAGDFVRPQVQNLALDLPAAQLASGTSTAFMPFGDATDLSFSQTGAAAADDEAWHTTFGFTRDMSTRMGRKTAAGRTSVFSLAQDSLAMSASRDFGPVNVEFLGFTATHAGLQDAAMSGAGVRLGFAVGSGQVTASLGQMAEQGAVLGMRSNDAFDFGGTTAITAFRTDFEQPLNERLSAFAGFEYGFARSGAGGLIADGSALGFTGFRTGVTARDVLVTDAELTLALSQPLRLESGVLAMRLPSGRTRDGTITYADVQTPLTPSGRETDISLDYVMPFGEDGTWSFSALYAMDAGHVKGAQRGAIAGGIKQKF